jgi:murein DD-endopeptidase MepM/ murein hydrolase activator NlpD
MMPRIQPYIAEEKIQGTALPTSSPYLPSSNFDMRGIEQGVNRFLSKQNEDYLKKKQADESLWLVSTATEFEEDVLKNFEQEKNIESDVDLPERVEKYYNESMNKYLQKSPSPEASVNLQKVLLSEKNKFLNSSIQYQATVNASKNLQIIERTAEIMSSQVFHRPADLDKQISKIDAMVLNIPQEKRAEIKANFEYKLGTSAALGVLQNIGQIQNEEQRLKAYKSFYNDIESGKWNKYLKNNHLVELTGKSTEGIESVLREIKQKQEEAFNLIKVEVDSASDDYFSELMTNGSSNRIRPEQVKAISVHEKNPQILAEFNAKKQTALAFYNVTKDLDYNDLSGALSKVQSLKPKPGEKGFAIKQEAYEKALSIVQQRHNQLNKDPAATVKQTQSVVEAFGKGVQSGTLATVAAQIKNGIDPNRVKLLTSKEAESLAKELNSLPPNKLDARLSQIENSYNFNWGYGSASQKIISEIQANGLNPRLKVAMSLRGTPAFNNLISAIQQEKELNKSLPVNIKPEDINTIVKNQFADFRSAVSFGGKRPTDVTHIEEAATLLTKQYMITRNLGSNEAAKLAYKQIIEDNYNLVNNPKNSRNKLLIPKYYDGKPVNLNSITEGIKKIKDDDINKWLGLSYQNPVGTNPKITTSYGKVDKVHSKPHGGVDFAGYTGQTVKPTAEGVVTFTGYIPGYGKTVEVKHKDGMVSRYAHLNSIEVFKGMRVDVNKRIGGIGSTGRSTGPHLHLEFIKDNKTIDPLKYLDKTILGSESGFSNLTINRGLVEQIKNKPLWVPNANGTGLNLAVDAGENGVIVLRNLNGHGFTIPFKNHTGK